MAVLLLGEVTDGTLNRDATAKAVNAVKGLGDVTVLCAGASARAAAADAAEADFINRSKGGVPDDIREVALTGAPLGIGLLLKQSGLAPSTSEANRLIDGGGVRVDSSVISDKGLKLPAGTYVVQVGKRKFARVTLA